MHFDAFLRRYVQQSYDYLLDRWGLPLGVVLQALLVFNCGLYIVRTGEISWFVAISCTILIGYHEIGHVRLQKMRAYGLMNAVAQRWADRWLIRTLLWTTIVMHTMAVTLPDLRNTMIGFGESLSWAVWYFGWSVMLRDRDETRFRNFSTASLDTGTGVS